jgi:hypothetical protein
LGAGAHEGQALVTPPAPDAEADGDAGADDAASSALDDALTIGTMPGQPGDLAEPDPAAGDDTEAATDTVTEATAADDDADAAGSIPQPTI